MDLNVRFIKSVLTLYDELVNNGISLVYLGELNHEITKMFTSMAESEMERNSEEKQIKKVVYHSMVETLQNMSKHSDEIANPTNLGKGLFMVGKKEDTYYIITSNKISNDKVADLKEALDEVNESTVEQLREMFKKQLRYGKLSNKGGAGLGLIDIARKTEEKLDYQFIPINDYSHLFILKVEINPANVIRRFKDREKEHEVEHEE